MILRQVVSCLFAVALVISQSIGATAHCIGANAATSLPHQHDVDHAHGHADGHTHGVLLADHHDAMSHPHLEANDTAPAKGVDFGPIDCPASMFGVEPDREGDIKQIDYGKRFGRERADILSAVTVSQPTPPPNAGF